MQKKSDHTKIGEYELHAPRPMGLLQNEVRYQNNKAKNALFSA